MKESKLALSVEAAARVSNLFNIEDVSFAVIEGRLVSSPDGGSTPEAPAILDWDLDHVHVRWLLDDHDLRVILPFGITISTEPQATAEANAKAKAKATKAKSKLMVMRVVMRIDYHLRDGQELQNEQDAGHFAGISGFMHAWPYLRAEVQTLTTKLGILPLVLPTIVSGQVASKASATRLLADTPAAEPTPKLAARRKTAP
jgi:hypothetical protein